jgi:ATP-dependent NAD(P)H-hydrate dehydratase
MLAARTWARPARRALLAADLFPSRSARASSMAAQKRPRTTARALADDDPRDDDRASETAFLASGFRYEARRTASFETRGEAFRSERAASADALRLERLPRASFVPSLTSAKRKGHAGRVAVVGGCEEYTGAPFFAAISALKTGCDVVHVFCTPSAAPVIKSYSPEIIAHPYVFARDLALRNDANDAELPNDRSGSNYDDHGALALPSNERAMFEEGVRKTERWLRNMDAVVIGPGLGRDATSLAFAREILAFARRMKIPTVVDADGLFLVSLDPLVVRGNPDAVLTPNAAELTRLARAVLGEQEANELESADPKSSDEDSDARLLAARASATRRLSEALSGVAILSKGSVDLGACSVTGDVEAKDKEHVVAWCAVNEGGSPRRCGGQGDVLAGTLATFLAWASIAKSQVSATPRDDTRHKAKDSKTSLSAAEKVSAAAHAALVTRGAAGLAFGKNKRATTASDLVEFLGGAFEKRFPAHRASYASAEERAEETETETALQA